MNYNDAIIKINSLLRFGSRPGLERISKLLNYLGNPQDQLKFVHVAGTNGKGSVCNMVAKVLTESGYKTGLFTSPYIIDFCERIQIDNKMISKDDLSKITNEIFPIVEEMAKNNEIITEFELITAIAFKYFCEQQCDIIVLETGLGGNYDSTNVIKPPLVSAITSISLDHTGVLGDTLEKIASEKSGIIKENSNTVFYSQEECVNNIIVDKCNSVNNNLTFANEINIEILDTSIHGTTFLYNDFEIFMSLIGSHQIKNAKTALGILEVLSNNNFTINIQNIKDGFSSIEIPARLELLSTSPIILLDGAHNPDGLKYLSKTINDYLPNKNIVCIIGMLKDKDSISSLEHIKGLFSKVITLTPDNPRALSASDLKISALPYFDDIVSFDDKLLAIEYALSICGNDDAIIICGSLYLASQLRDTIINLN